MKNRFTFALALFVGILAGVACGEDMPLVPSAWCSPHADSILGTWENEQTHNREQFASVLDVVAADCECCYSFTYQTRTATPDSTLRFESQGEIVVTDADRFGGVVVMDIEHRTRHRYSKFPDGREHLDTDNRIYETTGAKVWGDELVLWESTFHRRN